MQPIEKIGKVSSASVLKGTGKSWDQWVRILNQAGAKNWTHQEIVAYLKKKYKLSMWWQQGVTGGYENYTGRRKEGQNLRGEYSLTTSKTITLSAPAAWKFMTSAEGLAQWLRPLSEFMVKPGAQFECEGEVFGEVRTMKAGQYVRFRWQETDWPKPTVVVLAVIPRTKVKCEVVISHEGFKTERQKLNMRDHWKARLMLVAQRAGSLASSDAY